MLQEKFAFPGAVILFIFVFFGFCDFPVVEILCTSCYLVCDVGVGRSTGIYFLEGVDTSNNLIFCNFTESLAVIVFGFYIRRLDNRCKEIVLRNRSVACNERCVGFSAFLYEQSCELW